MDNFVTTALLASMKELGPERPSRAQKGLEQHSQAQERSKASPGRRGPERSEAPRGPKETQGRPRKMIRTSPSDGTQ